jgi:hypothetical protein
MKRITFFVFLFSVLLSLFGCSDLSRENRRFAEIIAHVKSEYAPDRKLALFDVTTKRTNKGIALIGEVDNAEAKRALINAISPLVKKTTDSIAVLPEAKLAGKTWGIVRVSAANMRGEPEESSELVSQATMGSVVKVLKENSGWYYVQTSDKYLGWMKDESFVRCAKSEVDAWVATRKVIVLSTYETVRQDARARSYPVCDLVAGSLLKNSGSAGAWTTVELPDGRKGYVPSGSVTDYESWKENTKPTSDGVEKTARSLLGIPYLWGEKFQNLRKGDLLFFGRKARENAPAEILHVALYLKDRSFIHSSGMVKINSLDPASSVFDASKVKSFICARRFIPAPPDAAIRR